MRIASCLLGMALVGMACGDDTPGGAATEPEPPRVCTQIGCESGVSFHLQELPDRTRRVRACVDERCRTFERVRGRPLTVAFVAVPEVDAERLVRATLRVPDSRGRPGFVAELPVMLRATRPNGPGCPPVCFQAAVRYAASGRRLEPAPRQRADTPGP